MKHYNKNNLDILLQKEDKTPRMSISIFFKVGKKEKLAGINSLLARLMLQGTKKYSARDLAIAFENECIDTSVKAKQDYIKVTSVFLNEDLELALELIEDIIKNSTFEDFEKEVYKIKGEIVSDLDVAKMKLTDSFTKEIFKNHAYSSVHTRILEDIDKITKEDIINAHKEMLEAKKVISLVGDFNSEDEALDIISKHFSFLSKTNYVEEIEDKFNLNIEKDELIWITKQDAQQAQIIQGCLVDSYNDRKKSTKISVLNNILGSSGLSSRLFVNLRDKQGLAYTVRSQYEMLLHAAVFNMYIGTAPTNIQKSLDGFYDELNKLATVPPDEEELKGAKENIAGRIKYFKQNNAQISSVGGYDYIMGLGLNYDEEYLAMINSVTAQEISSIAAELLQKPKVIAIIAPEEYKISL